MTTFGQRLKQARIAHGITQAYAEDHSGMGHRTWSSFETDKATPTMATLMRIAAVLPRTNMHWLVTSDGNDLLDEISARRSNAA